MSKDKMNSSLNPYVSIQRDPLIEAAMISIKEGEEGVCFICGSQQQNQISTPSIKDQIFFFKSNLEEDDSMILNFDTCSDCLSLIFQAWALHQQILSLQLGIKNIVASAQSKKIKKTFKPIKIKSEEIEEDFEYMQEEDSSFLGEILQPEEVAGPRKFKSKMNEPNVDSEDSSSEEILSPEDSPKKKKYFYCTRASCSSKLSSIYYFKKHMKAHLKNSSWNATRGGFNCSKCSKWIREKDRFILHQKMCLNQEVPSEIPELSCPTCFKTFKTRRYLNRHMILHSPDKPIGCEFCTNRFSTLFYLKKHQLKVHNQQSRPFQCSTCKHRFSLKEELENHIETHSQKPDKNYACDYCSINNFTTLHDLNSHLEKDHQDVAIFKCSQCLKSFSKKYKLIRHLKTHAPQDFNYFCDLCSKKFGTRFALRIHLKVHENSEEKSFLCEVCPKTFSAQQNLQFHIEFHSQESSHPFGCEDCEVRFKSREKLDKHFAETDSHNTKGSFLCQYCEKSYSRKYNLLRHERSHL